MPKDFDTVLQPARDADPVNHPPHYTQGKIEVIDFIDDQRLNFALGNVVKYVARARHKGDMRRDLLKARWYLDHEIERLESN